jgi:hypothetical protein
MFFRRMKINTSYESQLLCVNVLEKMENEEKCLAARKKMSGEYFFLCVLHNKFAAMNYRLLSDRKKNSLIFVSIT